MGCFVSLWFLVGVSRNTSQLPLGHILMYNSIYREKALFISLFNKVLELIYFIKLKFYTHPPDPSCSDDKHHFNFNCYDLTFVVILCKCSYIVFILCD